MRISPFILSFPRLTAARSGDPSKRTVRYRQRGVDSAVVTDAEVVEALESLLDRAAIDAPDIAPTCPPTDSWLGTDRDPRWLLLAARFAGDALHEGGADERRALYRLAHLAEDAAAPSHAHPSAPRTAIPLAMLTGEVRPFDAAPDTVLDRIDEAVSVANTTTDPAPATRKSMVASLVLSCATAAVVSSTAVFAPVGNRIALEGTAMVLAAAFIAGRWIGAPEVLPSAERTRRWSMNRLSGRSSLAACLVVHAADQAVLGAFTVTLLRSAAGRAQPMLAVVMMLGAVLALGGTVARLAPLAVGVCPPRHVALERVARIGTAAVSALVAAIVDPRVLIATGVAYALFGLVEIVESIRVLWAARPEEFALVARHRDGVVRGLHSGFVGSGDPACAAADRRN